MKCSSLLWMGVFVRMGKQWVCVYTQMMTLQLVWSVQCCAVMEFLSVTHSFVSLVSLRSVRRSLRSRSFFLLPQQQEGSVLRNAGGILLPSAARLTGEHQGSAAAGNNRNHTMIQTVWLMLQRCQSPQKITSASSVTVFTVISPTRDFLPWILWSKRLISWWHFFVLHFNCTFFFKV